MQKLKIAGVLSEVNDYSPFAQSILRIKIDEMVDYLNGRYGWLYYARIRSSVGKDSLSFSIRKDLNDVFGLDYHNPNLTRNYQHHFVLWTEFEFGRKPAECKEKTVDVPLRLSRRAA